MRIYIVIPAHNEESHIAKTLDSLVAQTLLPKKVVIVNDNSTDATASIIDDYEKKHNFISCIHISSSKEHLPGSKVIRAFYTGYKSLDQKFDIICKFDADLILPKNDLEQISTHFNNDKKIGMTGGFCYINKENDWVLENLTNKDHIRGALKAYRKSCFLDIKGLKPAMGWDTVDELLAQYHGWKITTDDSLHVKHLKPTGNTYNPKSKYKQGQAFYRMRYGFWITSIASIKLALKKKQPLLIQQYLIGYYKAWQNKDEFLVSKDEGKFIRSLRWKNILKKLTRRS